MMNLLDATFPRDLDVVRRIFHEYAESLGIDLAFQGFDAEMAALPGKYARPGGRLLLAWRDGKVIGCVALRPLGDGVCEMKRLYVRPAARGEQLGRRLAERVIVEARAAGYSRLCLDTLSTMTSALTLYASLGFVPIAPYVFNPIEGAVFLGLEL